MADTVRHSEPHVHNRNPLSSSRDVLEPQYHSNSLPEPYITFNTADMTDFQADLPERKPRKSVAFSEGATIVDSDGQVTESKEMNGGKSTAESHSGEPSPPTGQDTYTHNTEKQGLTRGVTDGADKEVEEVTDMFADLAKKVRMEPLESLMIVANNRAEEEEVLQEEGRRRGGGRRGRLRRAQEKEKVQQEEG